MMRTSFVAIAAAAFAFFVAAAPAWGAVTVVLNGTELDVTVDAANDKARVTTSGASIQIIDDGSSTVVLAVPVATIQSIVAQGNSAGGQVIRLDGTLSLPNGVTVSGVDQLVQQGDYSVGSADYNASVAVSITVATGTAQVAPTQRISSTSGQIFLAANFPFATTTGKDGIDILSATLTTATGSIWLQAQGGKAVPSGDAGVSMFQGTITSTGTGAGAGTIHIEGIGGTGASGDNYGLFAQNSTITSIDGSIYIEGSGNASPGNGNEGVLLLSDTISATGAAGITVVGNGGGTTTSNSNEGIDISASSITGVDGDVSLSGAAGIGTVSRGIFHNGAVATTGAGNILLFTDSIQLLTSSTVNAGTGTVTIDTLTNGTAIYLGAAPPGSLGLPPNYLATITASKLIIGDTGQTGGIAVTFPITAPTTWSTVALLNKGPFSGAGTLQVGALEITDGSTTGHSWLMGASGIQQDGNSVIHLSGLTSVSIVGGTGSDTFTVTPGATTAFTIDGGSPTPPALPGDTLNVVPGATTPSLSFTSTANGFQGTETFGNAQTITFSDIESGTVAPTRLSVSAPATAQAGVPLSFTVTALDSANNTASGYSGTVHFTSSDGSATLPADATLVNGVATFGATLVTLGSQVITATDTVTGSINGTSGSISVGPGPATHFSVSAPGTATSGSAFSLTLTAFDQFNNTATGYTGTVQFSSTDGAATLPANSTLTSGVGTFSATLKTAGNQTISATDTVTPSVTGTSNTVSVSAAAASHFGVSAPASATAGSAFSFTVTALDPFNNTDTSYAGTVHFTASDGAAILPANSTLTSGSGTFSATLKTAGAQTITATDTVSAITGTSNTVTVGAAAATHFTVSAPASATASSAFSFTVTALDPFSNTATGYSGTVHFTTSDGAAILPVDSSLTGGVGSFSATLKTAGSQTITATDTVATSITGTSGAITVGAAAASHFSVSAPATATAGSAFSFTVTALDPASNTATGYSGTVQFTSTDGQAVLPANATLVNGTGTFSATLKTAGSQTITATDTVATSITGTSNSIAVSAAAATHFAVSAPSGATAGTAFSFTVTAQDQFNNTATTYAGSVHFTASDGQAVLPVNSTLASGAGTFSATLKTAGGQTITATDTVTPSIAGTSGTVTVAAGPATHFTVSAPAQVTLNGAFSFTVTALDAFNNTASGYAGNVAFTGSDAVEILPAVSTLAAGAGTFSATLKTLGTQTITATDNVTSSITGTSASILVTSNIFSGPSATGSGTITASFTGGGATCSFSAPQFIGAPPGSPPVPPSLPAPGVLFPQGMFDFSLVGCTPGATIAFTITYPESVASLKYYKYGAEVSNPTPHWYVMPAAISGNTIAFSITDGGKGDDDYTANGIIVDQGGPGGGAGPSIPTLDWRMLLLLAAMLLVTAASIGNKRQR